MQRAKLAAPTYGWDCRLVTYRGREEFAAAVCDGMPETKRVGPSLPGPALCMSLAMAVDEMVVPTTTVAT